MSPSAVDKHREIYSHVTVIYIDNMSEFFEAVRVTDKGVIIGRFIQNEQGQQEFLGCGFIAHSMIQKIIPDEHKKKDS